MRQSHLDMIKWLALATMTLDHLIYLWPNAEWIRYPGRFAFVGFCAVMGAHAFRQAETLTANTWKQFGLLVFFAIVSEWPFRLLSDLPVWNIMPTLAAGFLVLQGVRSKTILSPLFICLPLALAVFAPLQYGLFGVLLPAAFWVAKTSGMRLALLPMLFAALADLDIDPWWMIWAFGSAGVCNLIITLQPTRRVPPVGRWAYAYYPLHLLLIACVLRAIS